MTTTELAGWLLEATLASTAAIVLVLLLRKPMRAMFGAGAAYALWGSIPVALLAMSLPGWRPAESVVMNPASQRMLSSAGLSNAAALDMHPGPAAAAAASAGADEGWMLVVWLCGMLMCAAYLLSVQHAFRRQLGRLVRRGDGLLQSATSVAGLPAVLGVVRATIVVPADFDQRFSDGERMLMQAHEQAHIRGGDLQINAGVAVLRCVLWFNPLLHWAEGRFRLDQEMACDARVLRRFPQARRSYGQAMLKAQLANGALPLGCHWGFIHPFKERILMLNRAFPSPRVRRSGLAIVGSLLLGSGLAVWAAQPATPLQTAAASLPALTDIPAGKLWVVIDQPTHIGNAPLQAPAINRAVAPGETFAFAMPENGRIIHYTGSVTTGREPGLLQVAIRSRDVPGPQRSYRFQHVELADGEFADGWVFPQPDGWPTDGLPAQHFRMKILSRDSARQQRALFGPTGIRKAASGSTPLGNVHVNVKSLPAPQFARQLADASGARLEGVELLYPGEAIGLIGFADMPAEDGFRAIVDFQRRGSADSGLDVVFHDKTVRFVRR